MSEYTVKDKVAIRRNRRDQVTTNAVRAPVSEFQLACQAIIKAAEDGRHRPAATSTAISGYAGDRNDASRLATAPVSSISASPGWSGAAVAAGGSGAVGKRQPRLSSPAMRNTSSSFVRWRRASSDASGRPRWTSTSRAPVRTRPPTPTTCPRNGSRCALAVSLHDYKINGEPLAAVAMADYYHAQFNPRAVMYGHPLTREEYDKSRWIAEPFHLLRLLHGERRVRRVDTHYRRPRP